MSFMNDVFAGYPIVNAPRNCEFVLPARCFDIANILLAQNGAIVIWKLPIRKDQPPPVPFLLGDRFIARFFLNVLPRLAGGRFRFNDYICWRMADILKVVGQLKGVDAIEGRLLRVNSNNVYPRPLTGFRELSLPLGNRGLSVHNGSLSARNTRAYNSSCGNHGGEKKLDYCGPIWPSIVFIAGCALVFVGLYLSLGRGALGLHVTRGHIFTGGASFVCGLIIVAHGTNLSLDCAENATVSFGSFCVSAPCYRGAEDVRVVPIIIAPCEFGHVQRQIFAADLVVAAHDAALQQRPKTVDRLGMDGTVDVLAFAMTDEFMRKQVAELPITGMLIGREQADFLGNGFANEPVEGRCICVFDNTRDDISLAACGTNNDQLASRPARILDLLVRMPVLVFAADISLVDFDNAHEFAELRISESCANAMAHIVRSRIGAEAHHALNLKCGNAFLARQHQIDDLEPSFETDVRIFENRTDQDGKTITALRRTFRALPMERLVSDGINVLVVATRATDAIRPTLSDEIALASIVGREQFFELRDGHLAREFGHRSNSLA